MDNTRLGTVVLNAYSLLQLLSKTFNAEFVDVQRSSVGNNG